MQKLLLSFLPMFLWQSTTATPIGVVKVKYVKLLANGTFETSVDAPEEIHTIMTKANIYIPT